MVTNTRVCIKARASRRHKGEEARILTDAEQRVADRNIAALATMTSAQLSGLPGMEKIPDASLPGKSEHDMLMLLAVNRVTVGRITQNDIERAFGKGERK